MRLFLVMQLLLFCVVSHAQFHCPSPPNYFTIGDTVRAKKAYRVAVEDTFKKPVARLGYIYGEYATREQLYDNLKVGLRMMGHPEYKIVGLRISHFPLGADAYAGIDVKGIYCTYQAYDAAGLDRLGPGDRIFIAPYVVKNGQTQVLHLNDVKIVIKE